MLIVKCLYHLGGTVAASVIMLTILTGCGKRSDNSLPTYPPINQVLKTAEYVIIDPVHKGVIHSKEGMVMLSDEKNSNMLLLLKACKNFHTQAPKLEPDFILSITKYGGRMQEPPPSYLYVSQTGELGYHNEWCYVPPKFQAWMRNRKKKMSSGSPASSAPGSTEPIIVSVPRPKAK